MHVYAAICGVPGPSNRLKWSSHNNKKVEAILKAPRPLDELQLRSFLGLLHYYGKFMSNLSSLLHPLNQLLKSHSPWKWTQQCDKAFQQAKDKLVKAPVLTHYDPTKKLKLATAASAYGIGAVFSHTYDDRTESLCFKDTSQYREKLCTD